MAEVAVSLDVVEMLSVGGPAAMASTPFWLYIPTRGFFWQATDVVRLTKARLLPYFHNAYLENRSGLRWAIANWLQACSPCQSTFLS